MKTYAILNGSQVTNVVLWDGDSSTWSPPVGAVAHELVDGQPCGIGWTWDDSTFVPPQLPFANQSLS